jgi:hypothetical protein
MGDFVKIDFYGGHHQRHVAAAEMLIDADKSAVA